MTMARTRKSLLAGLLAAAAMSWAACATDTTTPTNLSIKEPAFRSPTSTNKPRQHVMVQFTDSYLHPSHAQILEGGTVSWANYAANLTGSVSFPPSIRASFACVDLRPNWEQDASGIRSIPITGLVDDLELPCPLKPGTYSYELLLFDRLSDAYNPQLTLPGKITVQ